MEAARNGHLECVLWMLSNGSSIDEDSSYNRDGYIVHNESCKDILINTETYDYVKNVFSAKSSNK